MEHLPQSHVRFQPTPPEDILLDSELEIALKSLKTGKAPGKDSIPIEAYKFSQTSKDELFRICHLIWNSEFAPLSPMPANPGTSQRLSW